MLCLLRSVPPIRWAIHTLFWLCRPALLLARWRDAGALYRSRIELGSLSETQRRDAGLSEADIRAETEKPVFGEVSPWAPTALHDAVMEAEMVARGRDVPPTRRERSFYRSRGRADLQA